MEYLRAGDYAESGDSSAAARGVSAHHERVRRSTEVRVLAFGMESEVARSRAGSDFAERRIVRRERGPGRIEAIGQDLVESQVRHEQEPVVRQSTTACACGSRCRLGSG